jgi:hypothetical protein
MCEMFVYISQPSIVSGLVVASQLNWFNLGWMEFWRLKNVWHLINIHQKLWQYLSRAWEHVLYRATESCINLACQVYTCYQQNVVPHRWLVWDEVTMISKKCIDQNNRTVIFLWTTKDCKNVGQSIWSPFIHILPTSSEDELANTGTWSAEHSASPTVCHLCI